MSNRILKSSPAIDKKGKRKPPGIAAIISVVFHIVLLFVLARIIINQAPKEIKRDIEIDIAEPEIQKVRELPKTSTSSTSINKTIDVKLKKPSLNEFEAESPSIETNALPTILQVEVAEQPEIRVNNITPSSINNFVLKVPLSFRSRSENGRKYALRKYGGAPETEKAVIKALDWLAGNQNPDGSWGKGKVEYQVPLTGLAILAYMAHGDTPRSKKYGKVVSRGMKKLVEFANIKGILLNADGFGHAILAYALAETAALTKHPLITKAMKARIKDIIKLQNKFGSYNYKYDNRPQEAKRNIATGKFMQEIRVGEPRCDLSFAAWNFQALRSAYLTGEDIEGLKDAIDKSLQALQEIHAAKGGGFSFGFNAGQYEADLEMGPVGTLCLQILGMGNSVAAKAGLEWLKDYQQGKLLKPDWDTGLRFPLYTWYYLTQALFQGYQGHGRIWSKWNSKIAKMLLKYQQSDGAWLPPASQNKIMNNDHPELIQYKTTEENADVFLNKDDLKIYCTCLCTLMLEVYYRYLPTYHITPCQKDKACSLMSDDQDLDLQILYPKKLVVKDTEKQLLACIKPINFGYFNGKPATPSEALEQNEFSRYMDTAFTIQIRNKQQFPQILKSGQRLALFIDDFIPVNFRGDLRLRMALGTTVNQIKQERAALNILFNQNKLWSHELLKENVIITTVIPFEYFEQGTNVLQIRNTGKAPICFDFLRIENNTIGEPINLIIENLDKIPYPYRKSFGTGMINIELPEKKCKTEKDGKLLQDLKSQIKLSEKNTSFEVRCRQLNKLKANLQKASKLFPSYKQLFIQTWKRLEMFYNMGKRPVIRLTGFPNLNLAEVLSLACAEYVNSWIIATSSEKESLTLKMKILQYNHQRKVGVESCQDESMRLTVCPVRSYGWYPKEAMPYLLKKLDNNKDSLQMPPELWGIWDNRELTGLGLNVQKRYLISEPTDIVHWLWSGGTTVVLKNVFNGGKFFEKLTGNPKLAYYGLRRMGLLFEGKARKLTCNVTSPVLDYIPRHLFWTAAQNADGVATILLASKYNAGRPIEIVCPLPWYGMTRMELRTGFVPKDYPLKEIEEYKYEEKSVNIKRTFSGGIFKYKTHLSDCLCIRLVKQGSKEPIGTKDIAIRQKVFKEPIFDGENVKVTFERPDSKLIRKNLRRPWTLKVSDALIEGKNYKIETITATRDNVAQAKNVSPWFSKSTKVTVTFEKAKAEGNQGAIIHLGAGLNEGKFFSFWVYPHLQKEARTVIVPLYFSYKNRYFFANVKAGRWQRIEIPCNNGFNPSWGNLCFVGNPKSRGYMYKRPVEFEFNGFAVFSEKHSVHGKNGIEHARVRKWQNPMGQETDKQYFIFLGRPGAYAEYRYYFDEPVEFTSIFALFNFKDKHIVFPRTLLKLIRDIKAETQYSIKWFHKRSARWIKQFPYAKTLNKYRNKIDYKASCKHFNQYIKHVQSKDHRMVYYPHSQTLEIFTRIPEQMPEITPLFERILSPEELLMIRRDKLIPLIIEVPIRKTISTGARYAEKKSKQNTKNAENQSSEYSSELSFENIQKILKEASEKIQCNIIKRKNNISKNISKNLKDEIPFKEKNKKGEFKKSKILFKDIP